MVVEELRRRMRRRFGGREFGGERCKIAAGRVRRASGYSWVLIVTPRAPG